MKKNFAFPFILLLIVQLLSGCQYKDINRRLFIVEMGIDTIKDSDMIELTLKAAVPSSSPAGSGGEAKEQIYSVKAGSMGDALRMLKSQTSLEPEYSQMKTILVGKDYVENRSIEELIDFCIRRRDIQNIANFVVAEPSAKDIVNCFDGDISIPGGEVFMKFGQGSESPYTHAAKTYQIYKSIRTPGENPNCSIASIKDKKVVIERLAVFSTISNKMISEFSPEDCMMYKLLINNTKNPFILIKTQDNKNYGINLIKTSAKFKFKAESGRKITCNVVIKASATLEQTPEAKPDKKELSQLFSKELSKLTLDFLHKLQDEGVDPLMLQSIYWAATPSYELSDEWPEKIFPTINFNVESEVKIVSTGILQ